MQLTRKTGLAIAGGLLSVGLFGAAGYAYHESSLIPTAAPLASADQNVTPDASPAPADATKGDALKQIAKGLMQSAGRYLGQKPEVLMTQLKGGKTLADVANATAGKSRDGLVAALTTDATAKIDEAATSGAITADQAAGAKQKLSAQVAQLVDHGMRK